MKSGSEAWDYLTTNYPGDFLFRGKVLKIMSLAYRELSKKPSADESLNSCDVQIEIEDNLQRCYITFNFAADENSGNRGESVAEIIRYEYDLNNLQLVDVIRIH
ncbi:hypothetical protein [Pseudoduganella sp. R-34]|uniref:hypothetical protein n=1 Tax=unclassified Pseudoduganella TaxID=2637179 RepID=UPI003CEF01D4